MRYFLIQGDDDESNVLVSNIPEGLVRQYQLLKGISRAKDWPDDVTAKFSDMRPEGMRLTDFIRSSFTWLFVSDRFKKVLEDVGVTNVEYLPIKMKNHKKKLVDAKYWIANFTVLVEAVDRSKSVFRVDAADDTKISKFDSLVLLPEVEKNGPAALRMKEWPQLMLVREDLAARIKEAGFTGFTLTETTKYRTIPSSDD